MNVKQVNLISEDGKNLKVLTKKIDNPRAVLCIIHGLGEWSRRYLPFVEYMRLRRIASFVLDLRGHGYSEGKRGHFKSLKIVLTDIEKFLMLVRSHYHEEPIFLFGHSLGGNLVANYVLKKQLADIKGFILSAPWFKLAFEPPPWKMKIASILCRILPFVTFSNSLDPSLLTKDSESNKDYENDPLIHDRISTSLFVCMAKNGKEAVDNRTKILIPGLVYHGTDDQVTSIEASKEFVNNNLGQLEFQSISGAKHEPHNDTEKEKVMLMIINWMYKVL